MDHGSMDMDMDMDSSSSMSGHSMAMAFTNAHDTPLFSSQWAPTTTGSYAGTCIFLIVLAIISRMLSAYRHILEIKWYNRDVSRRYLTVSGDDQEKAAGQQAEDGSDEATFTMGEKKEQVMVIRTPKPAGVCIAPWRFNTDLPRACVFTVQHGVGYLLMLAVMTLNVGYFLSVLAGLFVGEVMVGRYTATDDGHH